MFKINIISLYEKNFDTLFFYPKQSNVGTSENHEFCIKLY